MRVFLTVGSLVLAWVVGFGAAPANAQTLAFDWSVRDAQVSGSGVIPVPHQGHDLPANHVNYQNLYLSLESQGIPLALMLQDSQGGNGTLTSVMSSVTGLDYVFADFESANRESHVMTMVSQVRNHSNPNVANAYIGNYGMYPGAYDPSQHFMHLADRTTAWGRNDHQFYLDSGLNIAQPSAYPYEYYEAHTTDSGGVAGWGTFLSPNKRSALFYGPLERISVAKRNLPAGHLLIPWLAGYIDWPGYNAPEPTVEDHEALAQHTRLRGSDGYYTLVSTLSTYTPPAGYPTNEEYRENVWDAWHELDWLFDGDQAPEILNLDTVKTTGIEWSGMRKEDQVAFLVSNLGDTAAQVDFPDLPGLPDLSPIVPVGTHQTFTYTLTHSADFDSDGDVDGTDFLVWQRGNGALGTGELATGDANFDSDIDSDDLLVWQNQAAGAAASTAASVAVPEPASVLLLLLAMAAGGCCLDRTTR